MDLATLLGLAGAIAVIAVAIIIGGSADTFVNAPSLAVVVGGTVMVTLSQVSLKQFFGAFRIALKAFLNKIPPQTQLIAEAVELAQVARKEGMLALENREIRDPFLKKGIGMCIDGYAPEVVYKMLNKDIVMTIERHEQGMEIFKAIAEAAPAMGMIGTLIGLVQMLSTMDDPKKIGPAMAIALLTTLYGAVIANAFAIPIAKKLKRVSQAERLNKRLILESVTAIQNGVNPKVLEQLLLTFLPSSQRKVPGKKD
ncbi:MAG: flagellar motor protein PomA [Gammaproteobacteria bacterium]|nr:MAG: flagellar motor protein PomA [Gammaproteobacteria bacterium]